MKNTGSLWKPKNKVIKVPCVSLMFNGLWDLRHNGTTNEILGLIEAYEHAELGSFVRRPVRGGAVTAIVYNRFKFNIMNAVYNLANAGDVIKCTQHTAYTGNADHNVWADVSATEIAASGGYSAGGVTLTGQATSQDDTDDEGVFDADNATWATATFSATDCIIWDDTTTGDMLIVNFDYGATETGGGGDYTVQFATEGIININ